MYICSGCLIVLSQKEKVVKCCMKGCRNNPNQTQRKKLGLLFVFSCADQGQRVVEKLMEIREVINGAIPLL